jgi:GAF domain-containing protein
MNALSVPVVFMAGITLYAGLYHWLVYRQTQRRENLSFALTCLAVGLYTVFAAGLYNASSVAEGVRWQRGQFISLAFISAAFLWFVADYTSYRSKVILYLSSVYFGLSAIMFALDRSQLTLVVDQPSIKEIRLPFGFEATYYEATFGTLANLQSIVALLVSFYILWNSVRFYKSGHEKEAQPLLLAMGIFIASVVNDAAVGSGLYKFIYTIEYAYVGFVLVMAYSLSDALSQALLLSQKHSQELIIATQQAEQATQAEREFRNQAQRTTRNLRQTAQRYIFFLERVTAGDYTAKLNLDEIEQAQSEEIEELLILGRHLNATVESLLAALDELQKVQRRYAREAWEGFSRSRATGYGFRYRAPDVEVETAQDAWLEPMTAAVQNKNLISGENEMALPITLREEVIGAIGLRREDVAGWSEDDVELAQAITAQLSQTIESLRLFDETQRRATRERLTARITSQVRASTEIDTILRTAIQELGQSLRASDGLIRLTVSEGANRPAED